MTFDFYKYQGTGNDFVMIDDRNQTFPASDQALVERICHRRFGVGADGLILLQNDPAYDFRMVYFNADGAEGSMCGNGGRCIVRFAHDLGLFEKETRFLAVDGEHTAVVSEAEIFLKMSNVSGIENRGGLTFLNTGSPHVVQFVDDLESLDVVAEGRAIRYDTRFQPGGTNVNFAQVIDEHTLYVRTYERGVEDETYSCGTGVTAVALVAHHLLGRTNPISIRTMGGNLRVSFDPTGKEQFENIHLIGPAKRVFTGLITV
ncbi:MULTISPECIES: diaminopimelate epimerase [unclassified Spirosoma]|uniref:diaminopimelate epimerase n=1 Tax=unclassified Spirosoma TaxID=2621999 RepID=UPI0009635BE8|nr:MULTISPECIES: diaminopimelate epimerase [unclassified Spirosoma]MBN8825216.1 diaminopimelate epimerase [Spirosoma sp.]OJW75294.1 MAG: diaminopimelate epimerase [Spirosoma sp. 48-14]